LHVKKKEFAKDDCGFLPAGSKLLENAQVI
jgi:hypothetical protein